MSDTFDTGPGKGKPVLLIAGRYLYLSSSTGSFLQVYEITPTLSIARSGDNITLTWAGPALLEQSDVVTGPWTTVEGATSPYTNAASATMKFYRLR